MTTVFADFNDATDGFVMASRDEAPTARVGDLVTVTDRDTLTLPGRVFAVDVSFLEIELLAAPVLRAVGDAGEPGQGLDAVRAVRDRLGGDDGDGA